MKNKLLLPGKCNKHTNENDMQQKVLGMIMVI